MKTVYLDSDYKCHISNDGTMTPIETPFFDGMCDICIECFRYVPFGKTWTRPDGTVFHGEMVSQWNPDVNVDDVQREYERKLLAEYEAALAEIEKALGV